MFFFFLGEITFLGSIMGFGVGRIWGVGKVKGGENGGFWFGSKRGEFTPKGASGFSPAARRIFGAKTGLFDENHAGAGVAGGQPGQEDVPAVFDHALAAAVLVVPIGAGDGGVVAPRTHATGARGFGAGGRGFGHQLQGHRGGGFHLGGDEKIWGFRVFGGFWGF